MKQKLLLLYTLTFYSTISCFGQNEFYFTEFWKLTTKENAKFVRIGKLKEGSKFIGSFADYSIDQIKLQEGSYNEDGIKDGIFKSYYPTGAFYSEGIYANGEISGTWTFYYENGSVDKKIRFAPSGFIFEFWQNEEGRVLIENGTGKWNEEIEFGIINAEFTNGLRAGDWVLKSQYDDVLVQESYNKKGKVKSQDKTKFPNILFEQNIANHLIEQLDGHDVTKKEYPNILSLPESIEHSDTLIFTMVDSPPKPRMASWEQLNFLINNLNYPDEVENVSGRVFIQFIVEKDGSISNTKVIKGIHPLLDKEAVRIMKLTSPWIPGYHRDSPRRVKMVEPILIKSKVSNSR